MASNNAPSISSPDSIRRFRCICLQPPATEGGLIIPVDISSDVLGSRRYDTVPVVVLVGSNGLPIWPASLFLAGRAVGCRGETADTARTYAESLIPWLEYMELKMQTVLSADEELLKLYRAQGVHGRGPAGSKLATATVNLRVAVVVQFHLWCQSNGFPSPLGKYLHERPLGSRSLAPRVIRRHPKILGFEEATRLMREARTPYTLMMKWGLVTGLRRLEVSSLRKSTLPTLEEIPFFEDGLARFDVSRKGGRLLTAYAPVHLIEETNWYVLTERLPAQTEYEDFVFINSLGTPISRQAMSREFRRCADRIGSNATLHHLRHTFAAHVLSFLEQTGPRKGAINSLKVVQVLLGHSRMETTEGYLTALEIADPSVVDALEYLYGGVP